MSQTLNRKEIARLIARDTGYRISDIETIMDSENRVITSAISQGHPVKNHKLYKLDIHTKPAKKAWDGLRGKYFNQPEKQVVKFVPLVELERAMKELDDRYQTSKMNESTEEEPG